MRLELAIPYLGPKDVQGKGRPRKMGKPNWGIVDPKNASSTPRGGVKRDRWSIGITQLEPVVAHGPSQNFRPSIIAFERFPQYSA